MTFESMLGVVFRLTIAGGVDTDIALLILGCGACRACGGDSLTGDAVTGVVLGFGLALTKLLRDEECLLGRASKDRNELSGLACLRLLSGL